MGSPRGSLHAAQEVSSVALFAESGSARTVRAPCLPPLAFSYSPVVDNTALHSVQSRLFTELVKDALTEYSYDAELAGLSYTLETQGDGIMLTVDGYNDKLHVLAKVVLEKMKELKVDEERLRLITDQVSCDDAKSCSRVI